MPRPHFEDDPQVTGRRIWRKPDGGAWGSGLCAVLFAGLALFMTTAVVLILITKGIQSRSDLGPIAGTMLCIAFVFVLSANLWRDSIGKRGMSLALTSSTLTLCLPAYRSLIQKPPACWETVPLAEVAAVETRLEVYGATGLMKQRAYRLARRDKPAIFLFEDRAVGLDMASPTMWDVAEEIARRAGVAMTDLGTVQGRSGLAGVLLASAPAWSTPGVSADRRRALLRRSAFSASVVSLLILLLFILHLL